MFEDVVRTRFRRSQHVGPPVRDVDQCIDCKHEVLSDIAGSKRKRALDLVLSSVALIALAPLLLGIALAVALSSPGPVIYRQWRSGLGGKPFAVLKFRSMFQNASEDDIQQAVPDDMRITSIGRFLRKRSLDELPQLFNVLAGSMSIVGPRPHAVQHDRVFASQLAVYQKRFRVKPGITGLAQVSGFRGPIGCFGDLDHRVQADLDYIENWSITCDVMLILKSVPVFFRNEGA